MLEKGLEDIVLLSITFKEAPTKSIDKEKENSIVSGGEIAKDIGWKRSLAFSCEQELNRSREIGEAVRIVARSYKTLRKARAIHLFEGCRVKHAFSCFLAVIVMAGGIRIASSE
jgi:hypothetical protein